MKKTMLDLLAEGYSYTDAFAIANAEEQDFDSDYQEGDEGDVYGDDYNEGDLSEETQPEALDTYFALEEESIEAALEAYLMEDMDLSDELAELQESEMLSEKVTKQILLTTDAQRLSRFSGIAAFNIARQANDPMYKEYKKQRAKMLALKARILEKYSSRATQMGRQLVKAYNERPSRISEPPRVPGSSKKD